MNKAAARTLATLGLLTVLASPTAADQTDDRLPALFDELRDAPTALVSSVIEQRIWAIWLETDVDQVEALMLEGTQAMSAGRLGDALGAFDQMVQIAPDYAEGWNKRATVHYMMDNLEESLADIEATLALEPRHFGALSGRGLVYLKQQDLENALDAFEETLEVGPSMRGLQDNVESLREALGVRDI